MSTKNLVATYGMIQNYKNERTNKWLALSEFIDNSISSWLLTKNREDDVEGLKVSIVFDFSNGSNKTITIIDNANGMDENELVNSLQPSDTQGKNDTKYNQYGVGMKLGIYWYGEDAEIYSKKNNQEYYTELKTSKHSKDEAVTVLSQKSFKNVVHYDSGTTIKIENVYPNRIFKQNDMNEVASALGWRYRKLLKSVENGTPGMEIWLINKNNDKKKAGDKEINVQSFFVKPFTLQNFISIKKKDNNFDFARFESDYLNDIEEVINQNSDKKLLVDFCYKLKNGEPLESTKDILWRNLNKYATLHFGVIDYRHAGNLNKVCGVTTFHLQRAINHGPNDNRMESQCIKFNAYSKSSQASGGNPTWRRLFGEINLTGFEKPDQNKSRFDWSYEGQEDLEKTLLKIWDELKPLLDLMIKWEKYRMASPIKEIEDKRKVTNFSRDSLDVNLFDISIEDCEVTQNQEPCFYLKDSDKRIWIIEEEEGEFVYTDERDDDLYIHYNINHKFWSSLIFDKQTFKYRGSSIYPLVLLIALCDQSLSENSKISQDFFPSEEKPKNFIEIMNIVVKAIESKDEN